MFLTRIPPKITLAIAIAAILAGPAPAQTRIYAAASLADALSAVAASYKAETGRNVVAVYAASSTLARQIEAGAKADLFLSADTDWMDYLAQRNLIRPASRCNLLGNALVVVAPAHPRHRVARTSVATALRRAIRENGRIAVGDPDHVPVGRYARQSLGALSLWNEVKPHLAPAADTRAALAYVALGSSPAGIVYLTDALAEPRVRIVARFPAESHSAILYPVALTNTASNDARRFLFWLKKHTDRFQSYGFTRATGPGACTGTGE